MAAGTDLTRVARLTEKMAKLRAEHDALGEERGRLWLKLNEVDRVTYVELARISGVTESKITKAIRRAKENRP